MSRVPVLLQKLNLVLLATLRFAVPSVSNAATTRNNLDTLRFFVLELIIVTITLVNLAILRDATNQNQLVLTAEERE